MILLNTILIIDMESINQKSVLYITDRLCHFTNLRKLNISFFKECTYNTYKNSIIEPCITRIIESIVA